MRTKLLVTVFSLSLLLSPVLGQEDQEVEENSLTGSFVDFVTGFPDSVNIVSSNETVEDPEDQEPIGGVNFWIVALFLVLLGILIYSFNVDPLRVLGIIAFLLLLTVFLLRTVI